MKKAPKYTQAQQRACWLLHWQREVHLVGQRPHCSLSELNWTVEAAALAFNTNRILSVFHITHIATWPERSQVGTSLRFTVKKAVKKERQYPDDFDSIMIFQNKTCLFTMFQINCALRVMKRNPFFTAETILCGVIGLPDRCWVGHRAAQSSRLFLNRADSSLRVTLLGKATG